FLQLVYRRWRVAAKLGRGAVGADRIELYGLLRRIDPDKAVKVGQPLVVVMGVALSFDQLTGLEFLKDERAGTHDVVFVPVNVLVEDFLLVNPVVRIGERRQERAGSELQVNDDRVFVRRRDVLNHHEIGRTRAQRAFGRKGDLVQARRDVLG